MKQVKGHGRGGASAGAGTAVVARGRSRPQHRPRRCHRTGPTPYLPALYNMVNRQLAIHLSEMVSFVLGSLSQ